MLTAEKEEEYQKRLELSYYREKELKEVIKEQEKVIKQLREQGNKLTEDNSNDYWEEYIEEVVKKVKESKVKTREEYEEKWRIVRVNKQRERNTGKRNT